ncbi:hypothetical protein N656DRAFT_781416 [Canariomyces notabilis]|uniref:Uncharacterized protein n=1 Tax=Canariomyces notabilis TaxID=2074819 RepID=A0AAN6QI27_9PEZI|nr:hypothetical protein N656DRAFT_781416 [Canariomyces arenarius]
MPKMPTQPFPDFFSAADPNRPEQTLSPTQISDFQGRSRNTVGYILIRQSPVRYESIGPEAPFPSPMRIV